MRALDIGDIIIAKNEEIDVWAVLGSCLCVIFHVEDTVSLLCHAQMASRDHNGTGHKCFHACPNPCFNELESSNNNKYVKCTLEYMINCLKDMGINKNRINTTLIGGASIIGKLTGQETVGERNIKIAKEILQKEGITINRELTGGEQGYNLWYNTKTDLLIVKKQGDNNEKFELQNNR